MKTRGTVYVARALSGKCNRFVYANPDGYRCFFPFLFLCPLRFTVPAGRGCRLGKTIGVAFTVFMSDEADGR